MKNSNSYLALRILNFAVKLFSRRSFIPRHALWNVMLHARFWFSVCTCWDTTAAPRAVIFSDVEWCGGRICMKNWSAIHLVGLCAAQIVAEAYTPEQDKSHFAISSSWHTLHFCGSFYKPAKVLFAERKFWFWCVCWFGIRDKNENCILACFSHCFQIN